MSHARKYFIIKMIRVKFRFENKQEETTNRDFSVEQERKSILASAPPSHHFESLFWYSNNRVDHFKTQFLNRADLYLHYDMESTQLPRNLSATVSETTAKHDSDLICSPFASVNFETVSSIVPYALNAALNVLLAIVATFANSLVFAAVRHSTSIRLPSKLLLCSLVLTDLGVGLVVQPQFATFLITKIKESLDISCFFLKSIAVTGHALACASLLTMTAISLDRYIALFFHLKYHEIVTTRRVCVVLAIIWSFALFYPFTFLWNTALYASLNVLFFIFCFLVISVAYIKIYRGLRHPHGHRVQDQAQVQAQQQAGNTLDLAKYRRSASSMLWIYGLFILCYLPHLCVFFLKSFVHHNVLIECILEFCRTLVLFNSSLNPFVYCFRLPEIRAEVLRILRQMCDHSPQQWDRASRVCDACWPMR